MIEIIPLKSLNATITVPGSKYEANRALICAALSNGTSVLSNLPENEDILGAIEALKQFGVGFEGDCKTLRVKGVGGKPKTPTKEIHVGNSGTLFRFILPFAALTGGKTIITGSKRICERPIKDLLKSLSDLGIKSRSSNGCAPIILQGGSFKGGKTTIDGSVSSQFISALLLASPYANQDVEIRIKGNLVSRTYVDMTIGTMASFGVKASHKAYRTFKVKSGQKYSAREKRMPADWSSANYFLALSAILPGRVKVEGVVHNSQESYFSDVLLKVGCKVLKGKDFIEVIGPKSLKRITVNMEKMPDSVQTLAAIACFAKGKTRITDIGHLVHKESNRINDTVKELRTLGIRASCDGSSMTIEGGAIKRGVIDSHNDHRMAMSFAVIGSKASGVHINNPDAVNKSFPGFWKAIREIGVGVREENGNKAGNIILIGYRGSGKTSTANALGKLLHRRVIHTDLEIESESGSISALVKNKGWEAFRDFEQMIIRRIKAKNAIIDCGGGVVERDSNIDALRQLGTVIWLKSSPSTVRSRISRGTTRPALTLGKSALEEVEEVLKRREPLYLNASHLTLDTDGKTPKEVAKEIVGILEL